MPGIIILGILHVLSHLIIVIFIQGKDSLALNFTEKKTEQHNLGNFLKVSQVINAEPSQTEYGVCIIMMIVYRLSIKMRNNYKK